MRKYSENLRIILFGSEPATFSAEYSYFEVQYNNYWGAKVTDSALSVANWALNIANSERLNLV